MRITLMVEALTPQLSGIGRYTWELSQILPRMPGIDRLSYRVPGRWVPDPAALVRGERSPRRSRLMPRKLRNWLDARAIAGSLVHGPNYFLPTEAEAGIITVHDLSVHLFPETHPPTRVMQFERQFNASLAKAIHIITDSNEVRNELLAFTGLSPEKVSVIPLGVGKDYHPRPEEEVRLLRARYGLPNGYGLCVSTLEPRKKVDQLILAWSQLPRQLLERHPLVLAGPTGWLNDGLHEQIEKGERAGWLRFIGFVPEADLPSLYAGARLFVYPSVYEGFGLPPIEAMASGVPTIVANRSCLPEVCGKAVLKIDPDDNTRFTEAVLRGLTDNAWREWAIERGLAQASGYSWERCAAETAELYGLVSEQL